MASSDDLPPSHDRLSLAAPPGPAGPRVPRLLERIIDDLQDIGMSPGLLERFTKFWKHYGLRKTIILFLAITIPIWQFVWIPSSASTVVSSAADRYGVILQVGDWTTNWFSFAATGEDVLVDTRGPYADKRLLQAKAVDVDWSLARGTRNAWNRLVALVTWRPWPPDEPIHTIRFIDPRVHVERLLSGRWNLQDAIDPRAAAAGLGIFRVPRLEAQGLRVEWIEHVPGDSGGGLIQQKTETLFFDDVRLELSDLLLPTDDRENPTAFTVEGRTANGTFSVTGKMNVARWLASPTLNAFAKPSAARVSFSSEPEAWSPSFETTLDLRNVGAAALARVLAPDVSIVPVDGTMSGWIKFAVQDGQLKCATDLQLKNVTYAANPRSSYVKARHAEVERGLKDIVSNGPVLWECGSETQWQEPTFRVAKAMQTGITSQALKNAAPVVRGASAYDQLRFVQVDPRTESASFEEAVSGEIGRMVGGETGAIIAKQLAKPDTNGGSPVSRGLKSVGRGFKGLFGGGKKDPPKRNR